MSDRIKSMQIDVDRINQLERGIGAAKAELARMQVELSRANGLLDEYYVKLAIANKRIAELEAENEWHPASEPPPHYGFYLSINEGEIMREDFFDGAWRSYGRTLLNVTHWRELPKFKEKQ